jgi:hypothetical protein
MPVDTLVLPRFLRKAARVRDFLFPALFQLIFHQKHGAQENQEWIYHRWTIVNHHRSSNESDKCHRKVSSAIHANEQELIVQLRAVKTVTCVWKINLSGQYARGMA